MSGFREPRTLMEVLGDYPELMGERVDLDPFEDDTPLECGLDDVVVCDSCQ